MQNNTRIFLQENSMPKKPLNLAQIGQLKQKTYLDEE